MIARGDDAYHAAEEKRDRKELDFRARALALREDADYVEITRAFLSGSVRFTDNRLPIADMVIVRGAAPCSRARDPAACAAELERKRTALFAHLKCDGETCPEFDFTYALTTRGDEVRAYATESELLSLLGPIDTPVEAWTVIYARKLSYRFVCESPDGGKQRAVAGGYELVTRMVTSHCRPLTSEEFTYRVDRDGRVELLSRRVVETDPERCVVH